MAESPAEPAVARERGTERADRGGPPAVAPDRVQRRVEASRPDRLGVADITDVPRGEVFLHLATAPDVFSRKVAGWAMETRQTAQLARSALEMALQARAVREVIFQSDRGSQCTAAVSTRRREEAGVRRSMGAAGRCCDNAMAKRLFATLECELLRRVPFGSREETRAGIFRFLEGFCNRRCRPSALGYLAPAEFDWSWEAAQRAARSEPPG